MQCNDLDLKDIGVLEDQLTGVDSSYFAQIFEALSSKEDFSTEYAIEVIEKVFE